MMDIVRQCMEPLFKSNTQNEIPITSKTGLFKTDSIKNTPAMGALRAVFIFFCTPKMGDYSIFTILHRILLGVYSFFIAARENSQVSKYSSVSKKTCPLFQKCKTHKGFLFIQASSYCGSFLCRCYADSTGWQNTVTLTIENQGFVSPMLQRIFNPVRACDRLIINGLKESVPELCP
jgi:hypothetical protein